MLSASAVSRRPRRGTVAGQMRRCAPLRRYAVDAAPVPGRPAAGAAGRGPLLACLLLGVAPWVGACATKAPTIRVDSATIRERSEDGTLVNLELTLGNNNTGEIVLGEFEYTVTAGSTFAGRRRAGVTLAPLSTTKVLLPAVNSHSQKSYGASR